MTEKTVSDLTTEFVDPLPADLFLSAHSAASGPGKVRPLAVGGGGGGGGPPLSNTAPLIAQAAASAGVSTEASRADHVHPRQNGTQVSFAASGNISATNVSSAIAELDAEKLAASARAAVNGVASLDAAGLVPIAQLPVLPASKTLVAATGNVPQADLQVTIGSLDSRINALTQSLTLAGTYNASTNVVDALANTGFVDGPLPLAAPANANKYLIINVAGTGIGNAAGLGVLEQGNWIYSDGTVWVELVINSGSISAGTVSVTPTGNIAATNVQAAIAELETEKVASTRIVVGVQSITGGGALNGDVNLSLSGDVATPGNNQVYGTNAAGNRGWKPDPAGGGSATKLPFSFRGSSLPLVTPASRMYLSGVAGNGVQYPLYEFSGSADNLVDLFGRAPSTYANGNLTVTLPFQLPGNTGNVTWGVAFCRLSSSFAINAAFTFAYQSVTVAAPSTSLTTGLAQITFTQTQANSIAAGDPFVMRIRRTGTDTATVVAYLDYWGVSVVEV